jgi:flavodoxin
MGMKRVLIVYVSLTGRTKKMAEYIAEGVRFAGHEAVVKPTSELKTVEELAGYDGCIFGSPTYHRDIAGPMKTFLFLASNAELEGKLGAAFGSYTHSGDAPSMIFDTLEHVFHMEPFSLGAFNLLEERVGTDEGMRSCHDYGRTFGERLGD